VAGPRTAPVAPIPRRSAPGSSIRDFIAVNGDITPEDLMDAPDFAAQGGLVRAHSLFGDRLRPLLDELPQVLIA